VTGRERRDAEACRILRHLVATLPKCSRCSAPATRAYVRGAERFCDEHGAAGPARTLAVPEYPRAAAIREALALLAETKR